MIHALTEKEFKENIDLFNVLEIKEYTEVEGKTYQDLREFLKEQRRKLLLVTHPDKGGIAERFDQIFKAHEYLQKYIEPLKSGKPCVKMSVDSEGNGCLTKDEFHYRKKLFDELSIGEDDAVGKNFDQLISILKEKDSVFKDYVDIFNCFGYNAQMLPAPKDTPIMRLFSYISPLKEKKNLINKDKQALASKFIKRQNVLARIPMISAGPLSLLNIITIGCYFSWWVIALDIVTHIASKLLINHYVKKYVKQEISTDEFISKMNYIMLGTKLFMTYPLAAFSVYLLTKNFIDNGLTTGGAILGPLLLLAIIIEVLAPVFAKGCEIYAEKHVKDLLEEDPKDRVQNATDLLNWYDPRKLLMFFIMPLIEKCFASLANELSERNFDKVNTNVHDTNTKQQFKDTLEPVAMYH